MTTPLGLSAYRWNNNLKSIALLGAFPLLLVGLLGAFFFLLGWASLSPQQLVPQHVFLSLGVEPPSPAPAFPLTLFVREGVFAYGPFVLGISALWLVIGYFFNAALIGFSTHAKPLERRENPEIYNILENLCIARGLAMPRLFLIETSARNAYASGLSEKDFSITLTRGLVETLSREEIEAVMAHELSHIINRDVRLLVITVLFGGMLSFFAEMLWRSLRVTRFSRRDRGGGGFLFVVLLAFLLLSIGSIVSLLLRFALSRKREYLADAGAVALTKRPEALISALEKIAPHAAMFDVPSGVQAMMIENPPTFFDLFDTHPPIEARIAVLRRLGGVPERGASVLPRTG